MTVKLNNKVFIARKNSENGEISAQTKFFHTLQGQVIEAEYHDGDIKHGRLLGRINENNSIEFNYHQLNKRLELKSSQCTSTAKQLEDRL